MSTVKLLTRGATVIALAATSFAASPAGAATGPAQAVIVEADSVATATSAVQATGGIVARYPSLEYRSPLGGASAQPEKGS